MNNNNEQKKNHFHNLCISCLLCVNSLFIKSESEHWFLMENEIVKPKIFTAQMQNLQIDFPS